VDSYYGNGRDRPKNKWLWRHLNGPVNCTPSRLLLHRDNKKKRTFSERKVFYKYLENGVTLRKKKGGGAGELFNMKNEDIYMA